MNNRICKSEIRAELNLIRKLLDENEGKLIATRFNENILKSLDYIEKKVEEINYEIK